MNMVNKKQTNIINKINDMLAFLLIFSIYIFSSNDKFNVYYKIIAISFVLYNIILILLKKNKRIINFHIIRWSLFSILCFFSLNWSIVPQRDKVIVLFLIFSIIFVFTNFIKDKKAFEKILSYFIISGMFLGIYIFLNTGVKTLISGRLTLNGYNSNDIGIKLTISILSIIYFISIKKKTRLNICILTTIIPFIFFTNSRKALLTCVLGICMYIILISKNALQMLKYIILIVIALGVLLYVIFNVEWFYNAIGIRFERLINQLLTGSGGGKSDTLRIEFIEVGINLAKSKPLFGYGIDNYKYLSYYYTGFETYSHNNYIELLCGVGGAGLLIYYSIYYYILKGLIKKYRVNKKMISLSLTFIITLMFMEIALVSYYEVFYAVLVALCYCASNLRDI